jgi:hypothetical protein
VERHPKHRAAVEVEVLNYKAGTEAKVQSGGVKDQEVKGSTSTSSSVTSSAPVASKERRRQSTPPTRTNYADNQKASAGKPINGSHISDKTLEESKKKEESHVKGTAAERELAQPIHKGR